MSMIVVTPPAAAAAVARVDALARRAAGVHVGVDVAGQDELPRGDVDALVPAQLAGVGEHGDAPVGDADLAVGETPAGQRKAPAHDKIQHLRSLFAPRRGTLAP